MARVIEIGRELAVGEAKSKYGDIALAILQWGGERGVVLDEVMRAVAAAAPIKAALDAGEQHVTLGEDDWRTLRDKLNRFPFGLATAEIAEFGRHLREAPEIGVAAAPA